MRTMNHGVRNEVNLRIKNGLDISDVIKGYSLAGENLTGAIIKELDIAGSDMSQCNLTRVILGTKDTVINMNKVTAKNCSFIRTYVAGSLMVRYADLRGSNFKGAFLPYADYKYADLRGCNFCDCIFTIGTVRGIGAKFSEDFFKDLAQFWGVEINIKK